MFTSKLHVRSYVHQFNKKKMIFVSLYNVRYLNMAAFSWKAFLFSAFSSPSFFFFSCSSDISKKKKTTHCQLESIKYISHHFIQVRFINPLNK